MRKLTTTKRLIYTSIIFLFFIKASFAYDKNRIKETFQKSNIVFVGKLIDIELKETTLEAPGIKEKQNYLRTIYTFEIKKLYKGELVSKTIQLTSQYNDFTFQIGESILVYAVMADRLLTSNFYLNGEKVPSFLAINKKSLTRRAHTVEKKELKKLKKLAIRYRKKLKK